MNDDLITISPDKKIEFSSVDYLMSLLKHSFFEHASGEWNDWRIQRNWDVYSEQFKKHFSE